MFEHESLSRRRAPLAVIRAALLAKKRGAVVPGRARRRIRWSVVRMYGMFARHDEG